jgi:putative DNA primase/helicase
LPGGRREGKEYVVLNPRRPDHKLGSFKINTQTGAWGDFAVGAKGRDLTSLAAYLFDLSQGEAARGSPICSASPQMADPLAPIAGKGHTKPPAGTKPVWRVIVPVPANAPPPPDHHQLGKPARTETYRDATGRLLGYVCRFDPPGSDKVFRPLTFCDNGKDKPEWRWQF